MDWQRALTIPGVLTVVKKGRLPALLSDSFVDHLRDAINCDGAVAEPFFGEVGYELGEEVIVQEGALKGVRGVVREWRNRRQTVIWVSEIGRGVALTIGSALVKPAVSN